MVGGRILVTGATGGLGRIMVERLCADGHDVIATGRNQTIGSMLDNCTFVAADLSNSLLDPLMENVGTVFHLAALSAPWGKRTDFERANILATRRLLAAAQARDVNTFVFASTPSIFTAPKAQMNIIEQTPLPLKFANHYATTKYAAELLVLAHRGTMQTMALRPRAIVSPYDTALLPRLIRASERGRMPLPGKGNALIELTDARDVVAAFIAAAEGRLRLGVASSIFLAETHAALPILQPMFSRGSTAKFAFYL